MPYIKQAMREKFDGAIEEILEQFEDLDESSKKGAANYVITQIIRKVFTDPENYGNWANAIATLECAKLEIYRRFVVPYENGAMARNGDLT